MCGMGLLQGLALAALCLASCSVTHGGGSSSADGIPDAPLKREGGGAALPAQAEEIGLTEAAVRSAERSGLDPSASMALLESAAESDAVSQMARLLKLRGDVAADDERSDAALLWTAVEHGSADVAKLLLGAGAPGDATRWDGRTVMHAAAALPSPEMARLLLEHGADLNATDDFDWTPLHVALYRGAEETALVLIEAGALVNGQSLVLGWRPLHLAAWLGSPRVVEALLVKGAEVNAPMHLGGWTPLGIALRQSSEAERPTDGIAWSELQPTPGRIPTKRVVAMMREAGGIGKSSGTAMRIISHGRDWGVESIAPLVQPSMMSLVEGTSFYRRNLARGAFTEAGADERLVSVPLGYDRSIEDFAVVHALIDKEGTTHLLWWGQQGNEAGHPDLEREGLEFAGLCRDGLTDRDHLIYRFFPDGNCCWPHLVYMYWDAAQGHLVEGFDDDGHAESLAEPSADGQCRWREAIPEIKFGLDAFESLRVEEGEVLKGGSIPSVLPSCTVHEEMANEKLAVLRTNATAWVSEPFPLGESRDTAVEPSRWEVFHVRRNGRQPDIGYDTGVTLVHDRHSGGWRSIFDCYYMDFEALRGDDLFVKVPWGYRRNQGRLVHRIKIDLVSLEAEEIEDREEWECLTAERSDPDPDQAGRRKPLL